MIDDDFLKRLDHPKDKADLLQMMQALTGIVENAQADYMALQEIVENIEVSALWILDGDKQVLLQNQLSKPLNALLQLIAYDKAQQEINWGQKIFWVKTKTHNDKIIMTATDITALKQQERLVAMGQMAGHLAHEIRNPIGSVSLLVSVLMNSCSDDQKELLDNMQKAIWRVERIIKSTLLFGKEQIPLDPHPITADELTKGLYECLGYYSYEKDIALEIKLGEMCIEGSLELLLMAFQNFLFNAIDAIEESNNDTGTINVHYEQTSTHHVIAFGDTGVPFPKDMALFEAYKSTKLKGNGLGLVLAKRIIDVHQGRIEVHNAPKAFKIHLPKVAL